MAEQDLKRSVELRATLPIAWAAWGVALFKLAVADGQVMGLQPKIFIPVSQRFRTWMTLRLPVTCVRTV